MAYLWTEIFSAYIFLALTGLLSEESERITSVWLISCFFRASCLNNLPRVSDMFYFLPGYYMPGLYFQAKSFLNKLLFKLLE